MGSKPNPLALLFWASFLMVCPQPRTAIADFARFHVHASGQVEATVNGAAMPLPAGFRLVMRYLEPVPPDTLLLYGVYPSWPSQPDGSLWVSGAVSGDVFCYWACYFGPFGGFRDPFTLEWEQYAVTDVINGYPMSRLEGEGVTIGPDGLGGYFIDVGEPSPARVSGDFNRDGAVNVQDLFDFLAAWFGGEAAADVNASGLVSVQDIFDFLGAYLGG
jgi:hypothetical protein